MTGATADLIARRKRQREAARREAKLAEELAAALATELAAFAAQLRQERAAASYERTAA